MEDTSATAQIVTLIAVFAAFGAAKFAGIFKPDNHGFQFAILGIVLVAIILYAVFGLKI